MYTVAIIGAGELGSRHLQGLARVNEPLSIHLVDPSQESLERAKARFRECIRGVNPHELHACEHVHLLPNELDFVISATTANHRLSTLNSVASHSKIHNILLEKILFQSIDEYILTGVLLDRIGARCWVNCARRMYSGYQELKDFFCDSPPVLMQVTGSNWGLGCNAIHFCDMFSYLTGHLDIEFLTNQLDEAVYPSKRHGFVEFSGTLVGKQESSRLELHSGVVGRARHLVILRSQSKTALIDEVGQTIRLLNESTGVWNEGRFPVPFQSELTEILMNEIIAGREPALPHFDTSATIHMALIRALLEHFNHVTSQHSKFCPIT